MGKQMERRLHVISVCSLLAGGCGCGISVSLLSHWLSPLFAWLLGGIVVMSFSLLAFLSRDIARQNPADSHTATSLLSQYLIQTLLRFRGWRAAQRLRRSTLNTKTAQRNVLIKILRRNAATLYGKRHGFVDIHTREEFTRAVPLTQYADYASYVKCLSEEQDGAVRGLLTKDPVLYLALSAGTTGKSKLIPVTKYYSNAGARVLGPLMYHNQSCKVGLTLQRVLTISYRTELKRCQSGLMSGPLSSRILRRPPFVVSPAEAYQQTNERTALHLHAVFGLADREVGHMRTLFSSLAYSFWMHIEHNWAAICDQIETGQLRIPSQDDRHQQAAILLDDCLSLERSVNLVASKERAEELRAEFRKGFVGIGSRIWPGLRSVSMITTGGFAHYAELLRQIHLNGIQQLTPFHGASEGLFGVCVQWNNDVTYTPQIDVGFFEFIPLGGVDDKEPSTVFAEQLQLHESYEMVYTSQDGLYRYRTGDVIKAADFFNTCPIYQFEYRIGQVLNLYWEKTPESVLYIAVRDAVAAMDAVQLKDFTTTEDLFTPTLRDSKTSAKHYIFFVEVARNNEDVELTLDETNKFDEVLCKVFELYETLRRNGAIGPIRVVQVKLGTFRGFKEKFCPTNPQYKVPRVLRDVARLEFMISQALTSLAKRDNK